MPMEIGPKTMESFVYSLAIISDSKVIWLSQSTMSADLTSLSPSSGQS